MSGEDSGPVAEQSIPCRICGSTKEDDHQHLFSLCEGKPLAIVIYVHDIHSAREKAQRLAKVRAELKEYFPDKEFEIQPSEFSLQNSESVLFPGKISIRTYIGFER